mmetsp:Transcript_37457/g.60659  ORF Transcript_37457/g.60659 Transcript_37457/m.60659 type:complete len:174 (-) Transcript_37457:156-677(-)
MQAPSSRPPSGRKSAPSSSLVGGGVPQSVSTLKGLSSITSRTPTPDHLLPSTRSQRSLLSRESSCDEPEGKSLSSAKTHPNGSFILPSLPAPLQQTSVRNEFRTTPRAESFGNVVMRGHLSTESDMDVSGRLGAISAPPRVLHRNDFMNMPQVSEFVRLLRRPDPLPIRRGRR